MTKKQSEEGPPRLPGHRLERLNPGGYADCECGKRLELIAEDRERVVRGGSTIYDELMDAHRAHLASLGEPPV